MSEKKNQDMFKNIYTFMEVELNLIKKEFREHNLGEFGISHIREKDGNHHFVANKKVGDKIIKEEIAEGISKDPFHAKHKLVSKLKEVLKAMKCKVRNPVHKREISFVY